MKVVRRVFLASLGSLAVGVGWIAVSRATAETKPLEIDPEGAEFVYRDGWIVPA